MSWVILHVMQQGHATPGCHDTNVEALGLIFQCAATLCLHAKRVTIRMSRFSRRVKLTSTSGLTYLHIKSIRSPKQAGIVRKRSPPLTKP